MSYTVDHGGHSCCCFLLLLLSDQLLLLVLLVLLVILVCPVNLAILAFQERPAEMARQVIEKLARKDSQAKTVKRAMLARLVLQVDQVCVVRMAKTVYPVTLSKEKMESQVNPVSKVMQVSQVSLENQEPPDNIFVPEAHVQHQ